VRAWKERGLRPFAAHAAQLVVATVPRPAANVITYIPQDGDRSLKRGHHPAQRLAHELEAAWGIECRPLLGRTRPVARQAGLSLSERRRNVRGAFSATDSRPPTGVVALVDDVYTTGATANSAAAALRAAGAGDVHVISFARAVR
jgi:predicted amidophosphoribosyltransferase